MTADVLIWSGLLLAVAGAASIYLYATRDTGCHSAGPRPRLPGIPPAGIWNLARGAATVALQWVREVAAGARASLPRRTDPAARDHPPTPQPRAVKAEATAPPTPPAAPAPQLDYHLDDNTLWRGLIAIKDGQP